MGGWTEPFHHTSPGDLILLIKFWVAAQDTSADVVLNNLNIGLLSQSATSCNPLHQNYNERKSFKAVCSITVGNCTLRFVLPSVPPFGQLGAVLAQDISFNTAIIKKPQQSLQEQAAV